MQKLYAVFAKLFEMCDETKRRIELFTEEIIIDKKGIIVKQGRPSPYIYFIVEGLVQIFTKVGEKVTVPWILKEGDFMMSIGAFFEQALAKDTIQAIERTVLLRITYDQLMEICRADPEFEDVMNKLKDKYYDRSDERGKMLGFPDIDRYIWFSEKYPDLLTRLPKDILCKHLNIEKGKLYTIPEQIRLAHRMKGFPRK